MSLNDVIVSLGGSDTFQVTRTAIGTPTHGRYASGAASTFDIVAAIEPLAGRELRDLQEGQRGDEVVTVYTATNLIPIGDGVEPDVLRYLGSNPDIIEIFGSNEPWTVIRCPRLVGLDGKHFEAQAARAPAPRGEVP